MKAILCALLIGVACGAGGPPEEGRVRQGNCSEAEQVMGVIQREKVGIQNRFSSDAVLNTVLLSQQKGMMVLEAHLKIFMQANCKGQST